MNMTAKAADKLSQPQREYLTFRLDREEYGIDILKVQEIRGYEAPTRIANSNRDLRQPVGSLPVTEQIPSRCYSIPWFKHYRPQIIEEYALAFRKVAENYERLLEDDPGNPESLGGWHFFRHR